MDSINPADIIAKKRDGGECSEAELRWFIAGVTDGSIPDYQVSAWLMATYLRGMTERETLALTLAMRDSGRVVRLAEPGDPLRYLDKHSTGGVGDKTTLIVVPILAACGVRILKMSGRGLGFSGGTVDKLESIPGLRTDLTIEQARAQTDGIGAAIVAQSAQLAPADKILYALRDVTATVESIPLIASSIMSKKLASGAQRILLDVKVGRGAFMATVERAEELARTLVTIGNGAGIPTECILSRMDEPLGEAVGNALEVEEALDQLTNDPSRSNDLRELCLDLAAHALHAMGRAANGKAGWSQAERVLDDGSAAAKFAEIVAAQGGPQVSAQELTALLPKAPILCPVLAAETGRATKIDAAQIGRLSVEMGAGRRQKGDVIDPAVGIWLNVELGEPIAAGSNIATLHLREADRARAETLVEMARAAITIDPHALFAMSPSRFLKTVK